MEFYMLICMGVIYATVLGWWVSTICSGPYWLMSSLQANTNAHKHKDMDMCNGVSVDMIPYINTDMVYKFISCLYRLAARVAIVSLINKNQKT